MRGRIADAVQAVALIALTVSAFLLTAFAAAPLVRLVAIPVKRLLGVSRLVVSASVIDAVQQVIALAIMGTAWQVASRRMALIPRRLSAGYARAPRGWKGFAVAVIAIALISLGAYMLTDIVYGVVVTAMPAAEAAHAAHTRDAGVVSPIPMLSIAVLAPLVEETMCRGLLLDFSLRLFAPRAYAKERPDVDVSGCRFWAANVLQALIFGILHANVAQSAYAFPIGLLLGWICWRTGKLRYGMICHFSLNANGYFTGRLIGSIGWDRYVTVTWFAFVIGIYALYRLTKVPCGGKEPKLRQDANTSSCDNET